MMNINPPPLSDYQKALQNSLDYQTQNHPLYTVPGTRVEVFSLPEGEARFTWPSPLSGASIKEIDAWLDLIADKMARTVQSRLPNPAPREPPIPDPPGGQGGPR